MKTLKILMISTLLLATSCGKDDKPDPSTLLEGHWHIFEFQPDSSSPAAESLQAQEAIHTLVDVFCDPLEYTFTSDKGVIFTDRMSYVDFNSGSGFSCPGQTDHIDGNYSFDNNFLTLNLTTGTRVLAATLNGELLTTEVDDLVINGVPVSGKLIYMKEPF